MFKIIFLSAFRSLLKYRQMSLINLLGLIAGLSSFLFTVHYVLYEFSFDSFITKHENVYRVNFKVEKEGETIYNGAKTTRGLFTAIKNEIPEVEANGYAYLEKCLINYRNSSIANQDVLWVSEDFEKVFPLEMISGVADYSRPRTGIISSGSAKAIFGNQDPIGKIIGINQGMPIEITGIFKDLPSNTHLSARYFASVKTWVEMGAIGERGDWRWNGWWNYIRLKDGSSPEQTAAKINSFTGTYMKYLADDNRHGSFTLQPLDDLHYIRGIEGEMGAITNYSSLINLIVIALVTLFIAWINYVNLSIAHARARSLQIGIRKLIGASNINLWHQSLTESAILNFAALLISYLVYFIFLNLFARVFYIPINQAHIPFIYVFSALLATVAVGILFSSIYHGFELAGINFLPDNKKINGGKFKRGLVTVQMAISIIFLISTIIVYKQIFYMKNKDLGVALNQVVVCTGPASLHSDPLKRQKYEGFKSDLLSHAGFQSVTFNLFVPGQEPRVGFTELKNSAMGVSPDVLFFENNADRGLIDTYQMKLLSGKEFSENRTQNVNDLIVNQTSMKLLGFNNPEEAIGKRIYRKGNDSIPLEIIGVVADFHNEGLQKPIYPMIWNNRYPNEFGYFSIRINSRNLQGSIAELGTIWKRHYSKDSFDFVFADDQFNKQYESESRYSKFYLWLTLLTIAIASMGLFGLILFYLEKRKKEIGVRKVNGATITNVLVMLNVDFIKWVITAFVIACPIAWFAGHKWLEKFAYKTDLSWWIFAMAGGLTLGIALLTVSWQSWKAATQNPVKALRYE